MLKINRKIDELITRQLKKGNVLTATTIMSFGTFIKLGFLFYVIYLLIVFGKTKANTPIWLAYIEIILAIILCAVIFRKNYVLAKIECSKYS